MFERPIGPGDLLTAEARVAALPEHVRRCSKCSREVAIGPMYDVRLTDGAPPFDRNLTGCSAEMVNGAAAYADIILADKTIGESDCQIV